MTEACTRGGGQYSHIQIDQLIRCLFNMAKQQNYNSLKVIKFANWHEQFGKKRVEITDGYVLSFSSFFFQTYKISRRHLSRSLSCTKYRFLDFLGFALVL